LESGQTGRHISGWKPQDISYLFSLRTDGGIPGNPLPQFVDEFIFISSKKGAVKSRASSGSGAHHVCSKVLRIKSKRRRRPSCNGNVHFFQSPREIFVLLDELTPLFEQGIYLVSAERSRGQAAQMSLDPRSEMIGGHSTS
jgi:hypothetical protein